jgi:hypothetical protein
LLEFLLNTLARNCNWVYDYGDYGDFWDFSFHALPSNRFRRGLMAEHPCGMGERCASVLFFLQRKGRKARNLLGVKELVVFVLHCYNIGALSCACRFVLANRRHR